MSRLAPLDKALVLILVPLWAVWFALGVKMQITVGGAAHLGLSLADAESYPALTGEFGFLYPWNPLEQAGLRPGDLLVRVQSPAPYWKRIFQIDFAPARQDLLWTPRALSTSR